jgi:hypothetical protein
VAELHVYQLWVGNVTTTTGTGQTVYTVPAGKRVVIRNVRFRNLSGAGSFSLLLYVNGVLIFSELLAASASAAEDFWTVLHPGDVLSLRSGTATGISTAVSGSIYTI